MPGFPIYGVKKMGTGMKIVMVIAILMMLFAMWPAYKHWSQNSPEAEKGDWASVVFALGLITLFVSLLVLSVQ